MDSYGFRKNLEAVERACPLHSYAGALTELAPLGGRAWYTGRCPLPDHDDKSPSFYIYPDEDRQRWHCYGCGVGGDLLDLHQRVEGIEERWAALVDLARLYGVELGRGERWSARSERQKDARREIERVRTEILRRRLFKAMIVPLYEGMPEGPERERELIRAWQDMRAVPLQKMVRDMGTASFSNASG